MSNINSEITKLSDSIMRGPLSSLVYYSDGEVQKPDGSDTNMIMYTVLSSDLVKNLLHHFWQRSSDACPLSVPFCEKEEAAFKLFVEQLSGRF